MAVMWDRVMECAVIEKVDGRFLGVAKTFLVFNYCALATMFLEAKSAEKAYAWWQAHAYVNVYVSMVMFIAIMILPKTPRSNK